MFEIIFKVIPFATITNFRMHYGGVKFQKYIYYSKVYFESYNRRDGSCGIPYCPVMLAW